MSVDVKVATERAEARIGSVIKDKWRLDRLLGVGGMACVYAATHRNKKRAALKILHRELSADVPMRERFLREGYVVNSVGHRGVVMVDDDDVTEDGAAFLVMELLEGETLEQRWRRQEHRLPLEEVLAIADQVLDVLAAAHDKGVVHRDLKPENLFLTRQGEIKLLDFGIGRVRELQGPPPMTVLGAAMGTPAFMAPEQARGRWGEVDGQTDLWALGATLYTLLTGKHVHEGRTVNETLAMAVGQPARPIESSVPSLPRSASALVNRALSYAKQERFADARAMQAEVRSVYAELVGRDVTRAAQAVVPAGLPKPGESRPPPALPASQQPTLVLSSTPRLHRASVQELWREHGHSMALALGGALLLTLTLVVARACTSTGAEPPAPKLAAAAPSALGDVPLVAPPPSAMLEQQPPPVSVDALPQELPSPEERESGKPKKSGAGLRNR